MYDTQQKMDELPHQQRESPRLPNYKQSQKSPNYIIYSAKSPGPEGLAGAFKLSSHALNGLSRAWPGFLGLGLARLRAFRPARPAHHYPKGWLLAVSPWTMKVNERGTAKKVG